MSAVTSLVVTVKHIVRRSKYTIIFRQKIEYTAGNLRNIYDSVNSVIMKFRLYYCLSLVLSIRRPKDNLISIRNNYGHILSM